MDVYIYLRVIPEHINVSRLIIIFMLDYYHRKLHRRHSSLACARVYTLKKNPTRVIYHLLADVTVSASNLVLLLQIAFV